MDLLTEITSYFPSLTNSEKKVAQYILINPDKIETISIQELAGEANVGESTIMRFIKKIGFSGYQQFKIALIKNQMTEMSALPGDKDSDSGIIYSQIKKSLIDTNHYLEEQDEDINQIAQKITDVESIYLFAVGDSSTLARDIMTRLLRIGKKPIFSPDSHIQAIYASGMTEKDIAIAITVSGNTKEVLESAKLAKKNGSVIIAITNYIKSAITELTEEVIICSPKKYASIYGSFVPKISQMYAIDVLFRKIIDLNTEDPEKIRSKISSALIDRID